MSVWSRIKTMLKRREESPSTGLAGLFAGPNLLRSAGWWRDDQVEQLRNYQSWVYAAVNAIAQDVARQKPFLFRNTGQADHEQVLLPQTHPLVRLLENPNPWMTPWELWYLTAVYLELTGNCYWYAAPQKRGTVKWPTPGELWVIPSPWVRVIPD